MALLHTCVLQLIVQVLGGAAHARMLLPIRTPRLPLMGPPKVVTLWMQLTDQLQQAAVAAAVNQQPVTASAQLFGTTIEALANTPRCTAAVWQQLLELQLPQKLVSACYPQGISTQLMEQPFVLAVDSLLLGFGLAADSPVTDLAPAFSQQLLQYGLLQHLSVAVSNTAQQIRQLQNDAGTSTLAADLADDAIGSTLQLQLQQQQNAAAAPAHRPAASCSALHAATQHGRQRQRRLLGWPAAARPRAVCGDHAACQHMPGAPSFTHHIAATGALEGIMACTPRSAWLQQALQG